MSWEVSPTNRPRAKSSGFAARHRDVFTSRGINVTTHKRDSVGYHLGYACEAGFSRYMMEPVVPETSLLASQARIGPLAHAQTDRAERHIRRQYLLRRSTISASWRYVNAAGRATIPPMSEL